MLKKQAPYDRGLTPCDVLKLNDRFQNAIAQAISYSHGDESVNLVTVDLELEDVLTTVQRFSIVNDKHVGLMAEITSYCLKLASIDPEQNIKKAREQFQQVFWNMYHHFKPSKDCQPIVWLKPQQLDREIRTAAAADISAAC